MKPLTSPIETLIGFKSLCLSLIKSYNTKYTSPQAWEVIFLRFPLKHGRCRMKIVDVIPSATTI